MPTYLINGKKVKSETPLSEDEIDEIAGQIETAQPVEQSEESKPVAESPTVAKQKSQAEVQTSEEGPSIGRVAGGLAAEIALAEGAKYAGAAGGSVVPGVGTLIGYTAGALTGGVTGSILAQQIENPNKPISWGRVVADTALNFIPGQKLFKGAKATTKIGKALVGAGQVATRGAVGSAMATGAQAVEKGIEEQRMLTPEEAKMAAGTGFALGGGMEIAGKALKTLSPRVQELFKKSPEEIDSLIKAGDTKTIEAIDELASSPGLAPETFESKSDEEFVRKLLDREEVKPKTEVIQAEPKAAAEEIDVEVTPEKIDIIQTKAAEEPAYDIPEEFSISKSISKLSQGFKSRFAPSKVVGGPTIASEAKRAGAFATAGKSTGSILESKINRVVSKAKNPEEANRAAYEYLTGKTKELPLELNSIKDDLDKGRQWIEEYQDTLLANHYNGQRPLEEPLLREIERSKNDGDYLTKAYLFFESPSYKPGKKKAAALKYALVKNGKTPAEAESYMAQLDAKRASGPDDLSNFVFSTPAGILKERKDLIPELRDYLGEVTETGSRLAATMSKLSRIDAYDTADFNIKSMLRNMGIAKLSGEGVTPEMRPLQLRRTPRLAPDQPVPEDQLYVPPEVQRSIDSLYGANTDNNAIDYATGLMMDMLQTGSSLSKAVLTLFNPFSYSVQPMSNMVMAMTSGANPFKGLGKGVKYGLMQYKPIASRMNARSIAEFKKQSELNLTGGALIQSDIEAGLRGPVIGATARKILSPFGKAYGLSDISFRNPVQRANIDLLKKVAPRLAENKNVSRIADEIASAMTNATYPNYDYTSGALKSASRISFGVSQFATFFFELSRNIWNQGRLANKMITGEFADFLDSQIRNTNPKFLDKDTIDLIQSGAPLVDRKRIAQEGWARMARLTAALATPIAATSMFNKRIGGVDNKEEQAVRESVVMPYDRDNMLAMYKTKDGNYYISNMAFTMPASDISSIFVAGFKGENFYDGIKKSLGTALDKIKGDENLLIAPLQAAIGNYIPGTNKKISYKTNRVENTLERAGWFAGRAFTTGAQKEFTKATRAYNPTDAAELALKMAGLRIRKYDPVEGVGFNVRDVEKSLNGIRSKYSSETYRLAGADLDARYAELNKDYQDNFKLLQRHINNMRVMKFTKEKIIQVLRDNGVGSGDALLAINGITPIMAKTKEITPSKEWDRISQLGDREQMVEIRNIKDIDFRKKVISLRKKDFANKRRGITTEDQLWKGLDEREQIDLAIQMMRGHNDPDAVLRGLVRKGSISFPTSRIVKAQFNGEPIPQQ